MKRLLISLLLFAALKVAGQTTGYLRFDTVKIMKQNGTCELYIINATKDSLGQLTNVGGGLTRFMRPRVLNDSMFIVGLDTLTIVGSGSGGGTVTTDATLTGDGTGGDPLKVDTVAYAATKADLTNYTTLSRFIDSIDNRLIDVYSRNDSVFAYKDATETFRFKVGEVNLGGIFDDPNNTIYTCIVRPTPVGGTGTDIEWDILDDSQHTPFGFSAHIESTTSSFRLFMPTSTRVQTVLVVPDEYLASFGVVAGGIKFFDDGPEVFTYYQRGAFAGSLVGDAAGGVTKDADLNSWTVSYTAGNGKLFLNHPTAVPLVSSTGSGIVINYQGKKGYSAERLTSALGGNEMGYQINDMFGVPIIDTLDAADRFNIQSYISKPSLISNTTVSLTTTTLYASGFANWWVIAVVERDPATPAQVENIVVTPSSTQLALDWDNAALAVDYEVERSIHKNYGFSNVYTGASSDFTDTGLTNGVTYYYRIRATDGGLRHGGWVPASGVPN